MIELIEKSAKKIKDQIEFWFINYSDKQKSDFNGSELFTFFDLIPKSIKNELINKMELEKYEIPVLILKISESEFIINSTHKFILLDNSKTEFLQYSKFKRHIGFKEFIKERQTEFNIKQNGHFSNFEIEKINGDTITRKIPSGNPGFSFWNTTKKCGLIGRKYKITE